MSRADHPLRRWLESSGLTRAQLSAMLPSHPSAGSLRQIDSGYRRPSWDLAFEVESVTGGKVNAKALHDWPHYSRRSQRRAVKAS